jgi:predicted NAD/FAD-dependent oxidoreductase
MCYTYVSKTSSPKDFEILKKPINDLIYLCGEHLCFDFIGTVHGAYISGIEAAERIIGGYVNDFVLLILIMTLISHLK